MRAIGKNITGACDIIEERYGILRHRGNTQGIKHGTMVLQLHQLERLTSYWRMSSLSVLRIQCASYLRLRIL